MPDRKGIGMGLVYCRRCRGLAAEDARCPSCDTPDPGGLASAVWGVVVYGALIATAVTGAYAYALSSDWERWVRQFEKLPPDHPLSESAYDAAIGIGVAVFVLGWAVSVAVMSRVLGPNDPRGRREV